ncbi:MAG TPA: hypothetical protein VLX59_07350 [Acidimicrobiales bacterium]|nr:hypothetical protein [Acidimicrobiales bacterium]
MRLRRLVGGVRDGEVLRPEEEGTRTGSHVAAGQVSRVVAEATALIEGTVADFALVRAQLDRFRSNDHRDHGPL